MGFVYIQGPITVVDQAGQVVSDRSAPRSEDLQSGAILKWSDDRTTWVISGLTVG
jgi:hypothetical protein